MVFALESRHLLRYAVHWCRLVGVAHEDAKRCREQIAFNES